MTEKSVFREAWILEMTSQSFPVFCFWSRGFVPDRKRAFVTQNTGKENRYRKNFFAIHISTLRRFNWANKNVPYTSKRVYTVECWVTQSYKLLNLTISKSCTFSTFDLMCWNFVVLPIWTFSFNFCIWVSCCLQVLELRKSHRGL